MSLCQYAHAQPRQEERRDEGLSMRTVFAFLQFAVLAAGLVMMGLRSHM